MTNEEFLQLVKNPLTVKPEHAADLKEMLGYYPFFAQVRILYAKALLLSGNIHSDHNLRVASLYCSDKHWFYYYLYPERKPEGEPQQHERTSRYHGSYFDILEHAGSNGGDINLSLKNLAERLKQARQMVHTDTDEKMSPKAVLSDKKPIKVELSLPDYYANDAKNEEITEELAKKYIQDKKFAEAIEILKKLNLINPKKSVYFADQIRFLEKVIANFKK